MLPGLSGRQTATNRSHLLHGARQTLGLLFQRTFRDASADGTGVPMDPEELAGRKGKQSDGKAKTRQPYLGWGFTQHRVDEKAEWGLFRPLLARLSNKQP